MALSWRGNRPKLSGDMLRLNSKSHKKARCQMHSGFFVGRHDYFFRSATRHPVGASCKDETRVTTADGIVFAQFLTIQIISIKVLKTNQQEGRFCTALLRKKDN